MTYEPGVALRAMQSIAQDAENISLGDERTAEQAAMALDALYIAYSKQANPSNAAEVRAAINGLFQQLENPSAYNADQFASFLKRLRFACIKFIYFPQTAYGSSMESSRRSGLP